MTRFNDIKQVTGFGRGKRNEQPLVDNEQADLLVLRDHFLVRAISASDS